MIKKIKDLAMPIAIVTGFVFHGFFSKLIGITPLLIFIMLFFTLSSIRIKEMKLSLLHIYIVLFQVLASLGVYLLLCPIDPVLAQGAMVIVIAPTATSAPVVAAMLGANISTMVTSTLFTNLAVALVSPFYFSWTGPQSDLSFFQSFWAVGSKVAPMIVVPLILALLTQRFLPKVSRQLTRRKNISFYLWVISLTIVMGSTVDSIFGMDRSKLTLLIWMFTVSIVLCTVQFGFGRWAGNKFGETVAGGQSAGQKNTVLAIWMAQTYMNPVSSVIPATYVLWQNVFNSYQIWQRRRTHRK
jgi:bile acid:Na+ symporter, BASS family